jgi:ADP-ribose pyrophosphatase YjhB (NUDIX family)
LQNKNLRFGCGIIILNNKDKVLLLHRDNIPVIPYLGYWDIPVGQVEENENPEYTVRRELKEKLGLVQIGEIYCYKSYFNNDNSIDFIFWKRLNIDLYSIIVKKGQQLNIFQFMI